MSPPPHAGVWGWDPSLPVPAVHGQTSIHHETPCCLDAYCLLAACSLKMSVWNVLRYSSDLRTSNSVTVSSGMAGFAISLNCQQKLSRGAGIQTFEINGIAQVPKQWQNGKLFLAEKVISPFQIFSLTLALASIILCWEYYSLTRFTVISSFLGSNRKREGLFKSLSCYFEIFNI